MADFRHVQPGQPMRVRAADWNGAMDAARDYRRRGPGFDAQERAGIRSSPNEVLVRNDSGAPVTWYGILQITGVLVDPSTNLNGFQNVIAFKGETPVGTAGGVIVVMQEPLPAGAIGRAVIDGVTPAQIEVSDDSVETAGATDGDTSKLTGGVGPVQIVWKQGGTGTKWGVVRLGGAFLPFYAQITAVAALGGSDSRWVYTVSEVTISVTASGGTPSATSVNVVSGGRSGKALNLAEMLNGDNTDIAFGVDRAGADYPSGFAPRPISGGGADNTHKLDVIVQIIGSVAASDGSTIYLFDRMGTHDGVCEVDF